MLSCVLICCVYGDTTSTIQTEVVVVVVVCLKYNIEHTTTTSVCMVSPYLLTYSMEQSPS